ncbi:GNAT family N-acetyltransferase [Phytoactinopolyspora mesophila]|uniref:GNAT family N-acetyltransferase n=1 Tax=Phytoactinopolyspora mesophila TaxID=2650750 RepID=UPI0031B58586
MRAEPILRVASFEELDLDTLYRILRLRVDVFIVEQECPYADLDGRDREPGALHVWFEKSGEPVAYLRVLEEPDGAARIGRVVVAPGSRGNGLASALMRAAIDRLGGRASRLHAQAYLADFYTRYGYVVTGPEFLDDGIPHVPMARPAATGGRGEPNH